MKAEKTKYWHRLGTALSRLLIALTLSALAAPAVPALAQQGYEALPVLSASKILPPELLSGPNHRVQERVTSDGYLNIYQLDSKFGTWTVVSTELLRKRIGEINAMIVMEKVQGTTQYLDSLKQAGLNTMVSAMDLVTSPVQTLSSAAHGLGAIFRRTDESLFGFKRSDSESSRLENAIGFAATKRQYAYQFGVDVYSDNQKMQDMLNRISWAGYSGSITWGALMVGVPGGAGIAISVIGWNNLLNQVFQNTPPVELRQQNLQKLNAMGVHAQVSDAFLNNAIFSPREQTLIVNALNEMNGVTDRGAFVRLALPSENPTVTFFRERQAEMYAGYHKAVTPLQSFVPLGQFAAGQTANGALVFNFPADYLVWTQSMAQWMTNANQLVNNLPGITERQLWLAGSLSPRARKEIESRGWQIHERAQAQLLNWIEPYSDYQRPENKLPTGLVTLNLKSVALGVGASWGEGVLSYQGKTYPFSISGLSLVDVGISNFSGAGKVYDLRSPGALAGTYAAAQASFAVGGGGTAMSMKNQNGVSIVILQNQGNESGTQFSLGPTGMKVTLK